MRRPVHIAAAAWLLRSGSDDAPPRYALARHLHPSQRLVLVLALLVGVPSLSCAGQPADPAPNEAQLQRLQRLKEQAQRNPGSKPFLYDYMQALEQAGRDAQLLALRPSVDEAAAPAAVLMRLGRAARNLKKFADAADLFRAALRKAPEHADALAGLVYALNDQGKAQEAVELLESHSDLLRHQVPLLEAYADAWRSRREYTQALDAYQRILALEPGNRDASRNLIFTLARLGAPHRALERAEASPGLLSDAELLALRSDRAAVTTRWGAAANPDAPARFVSTDAALAQNEFLMREAAANPGAEAARRRLQFDRIVALRNRFYMRPAVSLYESMVHEQAEVAPYAQVAAADAFLYLRQPERARDLYLQAQAKGANEFAAQVGLFYAYIDAEQHQAAIEQIDRVVKATPKQMNAYSPLTAADNPDYASAVATAAAARSYADRHDEAQARLEAFCDLAPWNMEAREKLAAVYAARGWPRRAEREYVWILAAEPRDRAARIGYAEMLRELRDWRPAQREAAALGVDYPEDRQVQRVARRWTAHEMRELQVEAGTGESSGGAGPLGAREHQIETRLFSAPIERDWRAFIHQFEAQASFADGSGFRRRIGAGAEYRVRDWRGSAEISESYDDQSDVGVSVAGDWWASDQLNVDVGADSSSNAIPLQARITGVRGWGLHTGATYRVSESRSFRIGAQYLNFNDGNRRETVVGAATQRLIAGPVYKLDGVLGLYGSRNSLAGAPYFNPERDFGADMTLSAEQRLWRRYERSFVHRLSLSLGVYEQKHFGSGPTRGVRYEHEWNFDERLSVVYGAQRTLHPYDGAREYANYYNLALNWSF